MLTFEMQRTQTHYRHGGALFYYSVKFMNTDGIREKAVSVPNSVSGQCQSRLVRTRWPDAGRTFSVCFLNNLRSMHVWASPLHRGLAATINNFISVDEKITREADHCRAVSVDENRLKRRR